MCASLETIFSSQLDLDEGHFQKEKLLFSSLPDGHKTTKIEYFNAFVFQITLIFQHPISTELQRVIH